MNYQKCFDAMVKGFDIPPDSVVLVNFWGNSSESEWLESFCRSLGSAGTYPLKWTYSPKDLAAYYQAVPEAQLNFPEKYFELFDHVDGVIDLCLVPPVIPHPDFPSGKKDAYKKYMGTLFQKLMNKSFFIQVKLPTPQLCSTLGIETDLYEKCFEKAVQVDYNKLKKQTLSLSEAFANGMKITIYTGGSHHLSFSLEGRTWFRDDGNGDIPAGEIYIAPIEDSGEGSLFLDQFRFEGKTYENMTLYFEKGYLSASDNKSFQKVLEGLPETGRMLCELGIGLNDEVDFLIGYAAYDEKCLGTAHIAVGMNQMFGGKNGAPVHIDFVFKPEKILLDNKIIMTKQGLQV